MQDLDDWGLEGPTMCNIVSVTSTYCADVKVEFETAGQCAAWFPNPDDRMDSNVGRLVYSGDMLLHDGKYYGDWAVMS